MEDTDVTIARIMMKLIQTAANDGIITKEEEDMLASVDNSLIFFKKALEDVISDGKITKEETVHLGKIKDIIINAATIVAEKSDNHIDKDELNILIGMMLSIKIPKISE